MLDDSIAPKSRVKNGFSSFGEKNDNILNSGRGISMFFFFFILLVIANDEFHEMLENKILFPSFLDFPNEPPNASQINRNHEFLALILCVGPTRQRAWVSLILASPPCCCGAKNATQETLTVSTAIVEWS